MASDRTFCRGLRAALTGCLLLGGCATMDMPALGGPAVRPVLVVRGGTPKAPPPAENADARPQSSSVQVVRGKWIDVPKPVARTVIARGSANPGAIPRLETFSPNPIVPGHGARGSAMPHTGAGAFGLAMPLEVAELTSTYGPRVHPIVGGLRMHSGIDLAAPTGTPVRAAANGLIEESGPNGGYGHYVRIRHAADLSTAYGHLSRYAQGIQPGVHVRQGDVIGYVGSTGMSTGPHLHYEVLRAGEPVDPMPYLPPDAARILVAQGQSATPNVARGSAD